MNKVETMVEGSWHVVSSALFTPEEKDRILQKLASHINAEGFLQSKSQSERTQLGNKAEVIRKMNDMLKKALLVPKKRKPTRPTAESRQKRLESKRTVSEKKSSRRKIQPDE